MNDNQDECARGKCRLSKYTRSSKNGTTPGKYASLIISHRIILAPSRITASKTYLSLVAKLNVIAFCFCEWLCNLTIGLIPHTGVSMWLNKIELPPTADFHVHLRDGELMELVVPTIRRGGCDTVYVMVPPRSPPLRSAPTTPHH